ncbi:MAG: hypothetical protein MJA83_03655 [Gammaproteobacteria bacterium]|nr:hypothetical protein [Gammaproteobacteria bacterium]
MNWYYFSSALIIVTIGLLHSILGERLVLRPIDNLENLPKLLGSRVFMFRTLRFAWHITSIVLWTVAGVLVTFARQHPIVVTEMQAMLIAISMLLCAVIAGAVSHGRHFSWILFAASGLLILIGWSGWE